MTQHYRTLPRWHLHGAFPSSKLSSPPDGPCMLYSILAALDYDAWPKDISPSGFQRNATAERVQKQMAEKMKQNLIDRHRGRGPPFFGRLKRLPRRRQCSSDRHYVRHHTSGALPYLFWLSGQSLWQQWTDCCHWPSGPGTPYFSSR